MAFGSVVALPLTRREMEVADLVRDGLTNREIAARLFLSERTVEGHVGQICSKLGVRSRLQIATWVLEQEGRQPSTAMDQVSLPPTPQVAARRSHRARLWIPLLLAVALALGAVVVAFSQRPPARSEPLVISTYQAGLNQPGGVVADPARGVVYIADSGNDQLRIVASDGSSRTVTGREFGLPLKHPTGLAVDRVGRLYIADTGNHRVLEFNAYYLSVVAGTGQAGFSGDDGVAAAAQLDSPEALAVDTSGNIYIADTGNNRVRVVDGRTSLITTLAGGGETDPFTGDYLGLYRLTIRLHQPAGVAINAAGDLFVADTGAHAIYEFTRSAQGSFGPVRKLAGTGVRGFSGDGGRAAEARISEPRGLSIDRQGDLVFADSGNNRIRRISRGAIDTMAGSGVLGFTGDLSAAPSAALAFPATVASDSNGGLYVADTGNARIRLLSQSGGRSVAKPSASIRPSFPAGSYMAQIQARGKLLAVVRDWQPFFAYRNPATGRVEGFDIDMTRAVARAIFGRDDASVLQFEALAREKRISTIQAGAADIADGTLINDANSNLVNLSDQYLRTVDLLLVRKVSPIRSFADIAGKTVCVVSGGTLKIAPEVTQAQPKVGGLILGSRDECLNALHAGRADAIYGHSPDTVALAAADPGLTFTTALQAPRLWGLAVPKGHPEFVQFLNGLIEQYMTEGGWNASARKWLNGYDDTFNPQIK